MKKMIAFVLSAALMLTVLAGCSSGNNGSSTAASETASGSSAKEEAGSKDQAASDDKADPSSEGTAAKGDKLILATDAAFPPYEYMSGQEIVGIDIDIAKEIAAEMGKELVIEDMPFNSVIASVDSGKADFGASGISVTEERAEKVDFTIEYAQSKQVILTRSDSGINSEADFTDRTIGVQLGTVADLALSEDESLAIERYALYPEAVTELLNGRIDAVVLDALPAASFQQANEELIVCEQELFTDVYAMCVQKGNTELLEAINKVLQRLMDEGKIEEFTVNHTK